MMMAINSMMMRIFMVMMMMMMMMVMKLKANFLPSNADCSVLMLLFYNGISIWKKTV